MKAIFLSNQPADVAKVYDKESIKRLKELTGLKETIYTHTDLNTRDFGEVELIFSTWGMPSLSEEEIKAYFPRLKAVFYGAGSVQSFARPFLKQGIAVFSAWQANAVPVAEYTLAQILLANKGFYAQSRLMAQEEYQEARALKQKYTGNYGEKVGLLGAGMIGSLVAELLRPFSLQVLVFDPFLSEERAAKLHVRRCDLAEIFSTCGVVSNHLANNPQTVGMLGEELFSSMLPYSTFLNTGRGAQVREEELVNVLQKRPDITAVLDVTDPEPPCAGHPFYTLQNCVLTPHSAGSIGKEVNRMAAYMVKEAERFFSGAPLTCQVTEEMLETMA